MGCNDRRKSSYRIGKAPLQKTLYGNVQMKILLVYSHSPYTFWSFSNAMKFIDRKASFPRLGLLTVAAMLPELWEKRLVDMTVRPLVDEDLLWADFVFISAMTIQRSSAREVIDRCRRLGVKTARRPSTWPMTRS